MNTIYHDNTFKIQIMIKTRALICRGLYGSVTERIKHEAFNIFHLSQKEFESRKR